MRAGLSDGGPHRVPPVALLRGRDRGEPRWRISLPTITLVFVAPQGRSALTMGRRPIASRAMCADMHVLEKSETDSSGKVDSPVSSFSPTCAAAARPRLPAPTDCRQFEPAHSGWCN